MNAGKAVGRISIIMPAAAVEKKIVETEAALDQWVLIISQNPSESGHANNVTCPLY